MERSLGPSNQNARANAEGAGQASRNDLLHRLEELADENRRLANLHWTAERRHASLLSLYVAALRLHASLDRAELLLALQEVLGSLVGCEEAALYEIDAGQLKPVALFGVAPDRAASYALGQGIVGRAVERGELYVAPEGDAPDGISACAPLLVESRPAGAIVLYSLLSQKPALEASDRELLEMLSTHAAVALRATAVHRSGATL